MRLYHNFITVLCLYYSVIPLVSWRAFVLVHHPATPTCRQPIPVVQSIHIISKPLFLSLLALDLCWEPRHDLVRYSVHSQRSAAFFTRLRVARDISYIVLLVQQLLLR